MKSQNLKQLAIDLQLKADKGQFTNVHDLIRECAFISASYTVFVWIEAYCIKRELFKGV